MSDPPDVAARHVQPPGRHQLAFMIWVAVFPTLVVLNVVLGGWLEALAPVARTFVLTALAVPIVVYGAVPQLHRLRHRLIASRMLR